MGTVYKETFTKPLSDKVKHGMFRRTFVLWFASLIGLFTALNLAGFVVHGSKQHSIGYPFSIVNWVEIGEYASEKSFTPSAILENAVVAVGTSAVLAVVCAAARSYQAYRKAR